MPHAASVVVAEAVLLRRRRVVVKVCCSNCAPALSRGVVMERVRLVEEVAPLDQEYKVIC